MDYTVTRVYNIDNQLVVADSIEEAIEVMRSYMCPDEQYRDYEPKRIEQLCAEYGLQKDYVALIKKDKDGKQKQ